MNVGRLFCFAMAGVFLVATGSVWAGPANEMAAPFKQRVQPFFQEHCIGCHNDEDLEGDFSLSKMTAAIKTKQQAQRWQDISNAISLGAGHRGRHLGQQHGNAQRTRLTGLRYTKEVVLAI